MLQADNINHILIFKRGIKKGLTGKTNKAF